MTDLTRRAALRALAAIGAFPGGLRAALARAETLPVRDGIALVRRDALEPLPPGDRLLARFSFPAGSAPVLGPGKEGGGHRLLWRLAFEGQAAGNHGDLYDNRDRDHSRLPPEAHPQLAHTRYDEAAQEAGLHYGVALRVLFEAPTIGNSSTALVGGALWRSQPRAALTRAGGPERLWRNHASGALRVYPEHRDHDPQNGDLLPANTPYYLISQGSSRSDLPHLEALAMILAAFRPDTKAALKKAGLIAPALQMVYRRGREGVRGRAGYISGAAHPTVFSGGRINLAAMVGTANALTPDAIPPLVRLAVESETQAEEGVDFFGAGLSEVLFDTPAAIARIWRAPVHRREMVISAAATRDPNGRELRFTWALLHGDPARTRITALDGAGRRARIEVDWQSPRPVAGRADLISPRIDIGVFAENGAAISAPAFVSILLPAHERRDYEEGPDGRMRPAAIDRARPEGTYADPLIFPDTPWRDVYRYDARGRPAGWIRHHADGRRTQYDASGARLTLQGGPRVQYVVRVGEEGERRVIERAG